MIELRQLRVFLRVSELKSFSKAALALGLTQPSVSRIIKELETEWDGELFYRTGRGVTLSEFGEVAFMRTKSLLRESEQATEELRSHSRTPTGFVSIGLPTSLVSALVPQLVNELQRDLPGIRLRVYEGFSDQIERWLSDGDIEVGVYSKYREADELTVGLLMASHLVLTAPGRAPVLPPETPFADLGRFPLVLPAAPNGLRLIVESVARAQRVELNVIVDADSILAQKQVSEHCGCYMVKALHSVAEERAKGMLSTSLLVAPHIERNVVLVTTQQRPLSRAGREVSTRATAILRAIS